jgi:hypothetical protein
MKKMGFLFLLFLCCTLPVFAQEKREYVLQVVPDSAFLRVVPDSEAEAAASVFANDSLVAVGRNIDGEWIEVRRPGRLTGGGWIARRLTSFTFDVALLPITDLETGLIGPDPVIDTGFSILTISEGTLRATPFRHGTQLDIIPVNMTLPVVERTPDNQWLKINFRGTEGWLAEYETRSSTDLNLIAISPEYAGDPSYAALVTISPEVQIAQIDDLVNYIQPIETVTADVVHYWKMLSQGETMECVPPAGGYTDYPATPQDIVELPELRRQRRILTQAIADINLSIQAMQRCGIYTESEISRAYADGLNALTIFRLVMVRMENLRESIPG